MTNKKEITAGIIIIGNEVLSGRTKDINTCTLAKWLNSLGIEVKEVRVIPDNEKVIIETVNILRKKFNYIFIEEGVRRILIGLFLIVLYFIPHLLHLHYH